MIERLMLNIMNVHPKIQDKYLLVKEHSRWRDEYVYVFISQQFNVATSYYSSMIDVLADRVFNLHTDGILRKLIILYHSMYNLWRSVRNHSFPRHTEGSFKHVSCIEKWWCIWFTYLLRGDAAKPYGNFVKELY